MPAEITSSSRAYFFDKALVLRYVDQKTAAGLARAGAYLRQRARSSIRRRKKGTAPAGAPPFAHSSDSVRSLRNIQFAFDPKAKSVVVGPLLLHSASKRHQYTGTVPSILEFGGNEGIPEWELWTGHWVRFTPHHARDYRRRIVRASYAPHPFMGPALAAEIQAGKLPEFLRGNATT